MDQHAAEPADEPRPRSRRWCDAAPSRGDGHFVGLVVEHDGEVVGDSILHPPGHRPQRGRDRLDDPAAARRSRLRHRGRAGRAPPRLRALRAAPRRGQPRRPQRPLGRPLRAPRHAPRGAPARRLLVEGQVDRLLRVRPPRARSGAGSPDRARAAEPRRHTCPRVARGPRGAGQQLGHVHAPRRAVEDAPSAGEPGRRSWTNGLRPEQPSSAPTGSTHGLSARRPARTWLPPVSAATSRRLRRRPRRLRSSACAPPWRCTTARRGPATRRPRGVRVHPIPTIADEHVSVPAAEAPSAPRRHQGPRRSAPPRGVASRGRPGDRAPCTTVRRARRRRSALVDLVVVLGRPPWSAGAALSPEELVRRSRAQRSQGPPRRAQAAAGYVRARRRLAHGDPAPDAASCWPGCRSREVEPHRPRTSVGDGGPQVRPELSASSRSRSSTTARLHVSVVGQWEKDLERPGRDRRRRGGAWWPSSAPASTRHARARPCRRVHRVLLARGLPGVPLRLGDEWRRPLPRPRRRGVSTCGACAPTGSPMKLPEPPHRARSWGDCFRGHVRPGASARVPPMVTTTHGADSEVGRLPTVMLHRPGNELKRLTPRNNDRLLFDGIPWVQPRAGGARRVRRGAARPRRRGALPDRAAHRDARERGPQPRDHERAVAACTSATPCARYLAQALRDLSPGRADRRASPRASATTRSRGGHGLVTSPARPATTSSSTRCPTCSSPATPASGSATAWRHQPGDAGAQARDPADRADLHRAPALRRHPQDPRLAPRARRGRRRAAARARRDRGRRRRAYDARRRRAARPPGLPRRPRPHRARRADRAGAGDDAPRHRLHDGRRRQGRDVPQRRRHAPRRHRHARRRRAPASPT